MSDAVTDEARVYALADSLIQLRYRAEVAWCSEQTGDIFPARVDARVGHALQGIADLLASAGVADLCAPGIRLHDAIAAAWDDYRRAWLGQSRRDALDWWRNTLADDDYEKRAVAIENSPLADLAWQEMERAIVEFRAALTGTLLACFDLSSLLADELYPTRPRDRRLETLDVSELRYLTVHLDRQVKELLTALSGTFPGLLGLTFDLSDATEVEAVETIQQLHHAVPQYLEETCDSDRDAVSQGTTADPGEFVPSTSVEPPATPSDEPVRPHWIKESDESGWVGELRLRGEVIRQVSHIADNIIAVLDEFEKCGWDRSIKNPFEDSLGQRLDTIRSLNKGLKRIKFHGGREKGKIFWKPVEDG